MKIALFAYTRQGMETADRIRAALAGEELRSFAPGRLCRAPYDIAPSGEASFYGGLFADSEAMIFVSACGIAVRCIAPFVRDKRTDPAVIAVDERARFVIPLLSGHLGGANALASRLGTALGAVSVVTTATDINGRFSADAWAAEHGFVLSDMEAARAVSAAILERDVPLRSDLPLPPRLPGGLIPGESGALGISLSYTLSEPFDVTLRLIPRVLHVGIGCRRGTPEETIRAAVDAVLAENGLEKRAVTAAASVELKADEGGLRAFCAREGWPLRFYTAEELSKLEGDFSSSAFVRSVTGVDNVCERAAMMGADRLIVKKTPRDGVTVAVAAEDREVRFG